MSRNSIGTTRGCHTTAVHVGTPPSSDVQDWARTSIYFHGFADLPTQNGECVTSPDFYCLGYEWALELYPRGNIDVLGQYFSRGHRLLNDDSHEEVISAALIFRSIGTAAINFSWAIRGEADDSGMGTDHTFLWETSCSFPHQYDRSSYVPKYLIEGALVIEVRMRPTKLTTPFIPDNPSDCSIVRELFMDRSSADIVFEISGEQSDHNKELAASKFYAHRLILMKAAPVLADMCMSNETPSLVKLSNVSPDTFEVLLSYIYGSRTIDFGTGTDLTHTKAIIAVADRFGITNLKLEAEAYYVPLLTITFENAMEELIFAGSMNCALLKEEVIDFIIENKVTFVKKKMLSNAPEGIINDVMTAIARKELREVGVENEFCMMSISDLRRLSSERGIDVDGSREALISKLESGYNQY
jgi:hypothetical protein